MNSTSPAAADLVAASQPSSPVRSGHALGRRRLALAALLALGVGLLVSPLTETQAQREFGQTLNQVASLFDAKEKPTVTATLELLGAKNLPEQFAHRTADLAFAAPDHLWVGCMIGSDRMEMARDAQEIWIWESAKAFGLVGAPGVAKFAAEPETSRDSTHLQPIALPFDRKLLAILPRLFSVEESAGEKIDGQPCHVLHATPFAGARPFLKLPPGTLTLWVREADGWPVRVGFSDGASVDVLVGISNLHVGNVLPESRWKIPAPPGARIQRVALSHLVNLFEVAPRIAFTRVKPLGPARGEQHVVATCGKGRLEMRDDTRVLFLRGTPEEMGEQHGTLLRSEVRDLIPRVLYGVGVGSSFAKGNWFFGEIEQCQARMAPFLDASSLREMDAMAKSAGVDPQEVRLYNFFPELFHCSGFALMGRATEGGRMFQGRILDYMKGIGLEANAVVIVNQPEDGHAWVNVGYAGFVGTVTAMNDQHISIGEMGGRGEGKWDGKPMAQLLREVMEKAGTLDEAIDILRRGPRTCEYYYVISDGKTHTAVGIAATPDRFDVVRPGEAHPKLPTPVDDTVIVSANSRYTELVRRIQEGFGTFTADSARALMTPPVCMAANIHSVLFEPDTLDFWVANADSKNVASDARYTHYNLAELLKPAPQ